MRMRPSGRPELNRSGTTLVELLVALTVFTLFGGIVLAQLRTSGRSLTALAQRLDVQQALWQGGDMIATELRAVSSPSGDILLLADSSLWYKGVVATGIACRIPNASSIDLAPDSLSSGMRTGSGAASVQPSDVLSLFDEGPLPGAGDDRWVQLTITSSGPRTGLCNGTAYVDPVLDAGRSGYHLTLAVPIPSTVALLPGTAVRITRPSRIALYRASTADWWLGWSDWNAALGGWNIIQPVSGAYRPYATAPRPSGVSLAGRDSTGTLVPSPTATSAVAEIAFMLRTQVTTSQVGIGVAQTTKNDSISSRVALRNRQ